MEFADPPIVNGRWWQTMKAKQARIDFFITNCLTNEYKETDVTLPEKLGSDRQHFATAIFARAHSSRPPWPRIIGRDRCTRDNARLAWLDPRDSHNSARVKVADASRRSKLNDWQNDRLANAYGRPETALPDFWINKMLQNKRTSKAFKMKSN